MLDNLSRSAESASKYNTYVHGESITLNDLQCHLQLLQYVLVSVAREVKH